MPKKPQAKPQGFSRRSWHRRASKPISYWMIALVIAVCAHPIIPQFRWLLVHMVTLGLVTTSILIWGQHFTEALLKTKLAEESRPSQVRRIWALTGFTALTMVGMVASVPIITVVGALGISAMLLWYAYALGAQVKAALAPRFTFVVRSYQIAACLLPLGAVLGAVLAFSPGEPWQGRLLLAHQIVNILGFVGVTATATLLTLWPTILRTRLDGSKATRASRSLILMVLGVSIAMLGALINNLLVGAAGVGVYVLGQLSIFALLLRLAGRAAKQTRREPIALFPALSIGASALWFLGTTVTLGVMWVGSAGSADGSPVQSPLNFSLVASDLQQLTVPFVVGFLLQLLLGAMSFLMPTSMGGGPRALKASLAVMSRFAVFRVVVLNLALSLFAFASIDSTLGKALFGAVTFGIFGPQQFGSVTRVIVSLAAFLVLALFIVLMLRMVKVNVRERIEFQKRTAMGMPTMGAPGTQTNSGSEPATSNDPLGNAALAHYPKPSETAVAQAPSATSSNPEATAQPVSAGHRPGSAHSLPGVQRRHLTSALAGMGAVFGLSAIGRAFDGTLDGAGITPASGTPSRDAAPAATVQPTGDTTRVKVEMTAEMRFNPDSIDVPAGDQLIIELHNLDHANVHDLVLDNGAYSGRVQAHDTLEFDAGIITANMEGWCSVVGHKAMGMVLKINAIGAQGAHEGTTSGQAGQATAGSDPLSRVLADLTLAPGASHERRDPVLPPLGPREQKLTFTVSEQHLELAPGVAMQSMVYNGVLMGPVIHAPLGGKVDLTLVNEGSMGHSIDFHAGTVAPNKYMRTIAQGESLHYPFTTDYAGAWLYHCSTAPMTVHLSSGMYGVLIVPPQGLAEADREYVLVQSEHYLSPEAAKDEAGNALQGPDGTAVHTVSSEKIFAERPDFTVFNGHATQYVNEPLQAKVGERVRIWVLAAGPSRGISFHIVGTVFDTVFKEGEYQLRPDNETGGGAQALDLASCQGGFIETVFREAGTYKAVNHQFVDLERGALAIINVTD